MGMTQECVEQFIGRLLTDDTFRAALPERFQQLCREAGLNLTEHKRAALQTLDLPRFAKLAGEIDTSLRRFGKVR